MQYKPNATYCATYAKHVLAIMCMSGNLMREFNSADVAAHRTCYQSESDPFSSACACSMEWHINLECAPLLTAVSAVDAHVIP